MVVSFNIDGYRGVDSSARENFHPRTGDRDAATTFLKPQGITIYGNDPSSNSYSNLKDLRKITKGYSDLQIHSGLLDFSQADILSNTVDSHTSNGMHGNGFRIRWKFSGTPHDKTSVLFNQYNPRALVDSMQEGYGDNWKIEIFKGTHYNNKDRYRRTYARNDIIKATRCRIGSTLYSRPTLNEDLDPDNHFTSVQMHGPGFETVFLNDAIIPSAGVENGTGFFHEKGKNWYAYVRSLQMLSCLIYLEVLYYRLLNLDMQI